MKVAILYNTTDYLIRFRAELIKSIQGCDCEVIAITPEDHMSDHLEFLGVRWCEWKLAGQSLNPLKDLASIYYLFQILKKERPDVIINFTVKPVLYGSLVASFLQPIRIVSMITGMGSLFLPGGAKKRFFIKGVHLLYRLAMKRNHRVLFQNDEDMTYFLNHDFISVEQAVRINGSGVNLEVFSPRPQEVCQGRFLLVSRMIKEKGIYDFVEAARMVKTEFPNASFVLVGPIDNNPSAITLEEIKAWEKEGIIRYEGRQSDVRPSLARSEVYVLPSYYLEGVPRSILEALSMGKPVITTNWRGCRDTVEEGVNGFLVPPRDARKLKDAMCYFLKDPTLSVTFGEASRQLAKERFDVKYVNARVMQSMGLQSKRNSNVDDLAGGRP